MSAESDPRFRSREHVEGDLLVSSGDDELAEGRSELRTAAGRTGVVDVCVLWTERVFLGEKKQTNYLQRFSILRLFKETRLIDLIMLQHYVIIIRRILLLVHRYFW